MPPGPAPGLTRERDLYALLGVSPDADTDEITAAFRARAKELHPDRAPSVPGADEQFKTLSRAYATLRSPRSRAAYDARLARRPTPATPGVTRSATARRTRPELLDTTRRAVLAIWGGMLCIVAGLAIVPVLVTMDTSPDTVGRDVTLWIVVVKLVVCGAILVGAGWWRRASLRRAAA